MAVGMSEKALEACGPRRQPITHLLIRARRVREIARAVRRRIRRPPLLPCSTPCAISTNFEAASTAFGQAGWAFVDPFFEPEFFAQLRAGWPGRDYFRPMENPLKSYDFGFRWQRDKATQTPHLERFPAFAAAYRTLQSPEFARRVTEFCNDGITRSCYSMTSTWATAGSALIAHRDSFGQRPHDKAPGAFINFVFFIDASGQAPYAGGTCILADNEFRDVIFEPTNLRNTALVYQKEASFYHGFRPLARGAFRLAIIAEYCDVDFHLGMLES